MWTEAPIEGVQNATDAQSLLFAGVAMHGKKIIFLFFLVGKEEASASIKANIKSNF